MLNLAKIWEKKATGWLLVGIALAVLFIFLRVLHLDSDTPAPKLTEYVPVDELYYTIPAFNLYHYGSMVHRVVPYVDDDGMPVNLLENVLTFVSLKIWGNNYYGLRMASVISAFIIFLLMYFVLRKIRQGQAYEEDDDWPAGSKASFYLVIFLALLYLVIDFPFLVAGRVAEPSIFRILAMMIIIYLGSLRCFQSELRSPPLSALLGFLSFSAVVYVYVYNVFLFLALAVTTFCWAVKAGWHNAFKQILFFIIGAIISLFSYNLLVELIYGQNLIDLYNSLLPYHQRLGPTPALGIVLMLKHYLNNFIAVFSTNIFRFNVALLFIFVIALPVFIAKTYKKRDNFDILLFNILFFLVMQSIIINDYNFRKMIVLLPLVLLIIVIAYVNADSFLKLMNNSSTSRSLFKLYWLVIGYFFTLFIHLGSIKPAAINAEIAINPQAQMPVGLSRINLLVFLLVFLIITLRYLSTKKMPRILLALALVLLFVPGLYLDFRTVILHPEYTYRDTMIAMKEKVDNKVVAGGFAIGFRLYNSSIPVMNFYKYIYSPERMAVYNATMKRLFDENIAQYSIHYHKEPNFNEKSYMRQRGFCVDKRYDDLITLYRPSRHIIESKQISKNVSP